MEVDTVDPPHEGGLRGKEGAGSSLPGFQAAAVQASTSLGPALETDSAGLGKVGLG